MIPLKQIQEKSEYFTTVSLKKDEILFEEWDIDGHLYIIYNGSIIIEQSVHYGENTFKILSSLQSWDIIWEQALIEQKPKEVRVRAESDSQLLSIRGGSAFETFVKNEPRLWYTVMLGIISLSNERILKSNKEITANHEINLAISKIKDFSLDAIYKLIIIIQGILEVDQIMYFEKNLVMDHYFKLRYDSYQAHSVQNTILKFENNQVDFDLLEKEKIHTWKYHLSAPLSLWDINHGFLVIARENKVFQENEEKLLRNTAGSLVGVIHQKKLIEEQRNIDYMKNI